MTDSDTYVMKNGLVRWFVRYYAQSAEKAFSAHALLKTIDDTYTNTDRAPEFVQSARKELMLEIKNTAFALKPKVNIKQFELDVFEYTHDDEKIVQKYLDQNVTKAYDRAQSIDTVRFIHLLEAKSLSAGSDKKSEQSEQELDIVSQLDQLKYDDTSSEPEVDIIPNFEQIKQPLGVFDNMSIKSDESTTS